MKLPSPTIPYETWKIESDNKNCDMSTMSLHLEKEQVDGSINGNILAERLKDTGMSASVLDYLMEHQDEIPASWKEKTKDGYTQFIYFWGTIYRRSDGSLCVRCLYFGEGLWEQDYGWLGHDFVGNDPACVSASPLTSTTQSSSDTLSFEQALKIVKDAGWTVSRTRTITEEL